MYAQAEPEIDIQLTLVIRHTSLLGVRNAHTSLLQVGDEVEVMYFAAKSAIEREDWMKQFRQGISVMHMYTYIGKYLLLL